MMKFGSVCSGIEAASVAWHPLGWRAAWLAEIEPFPAAVLAHHYPDVPNLGDMTSLPERIRSGEVAAPDVFCGGTPCQAFSIAGLRRSLDDARGNLSLVFCEIADAIDSVRLSAGDEPAIIVWENVPGVLSTSDNAFGCFLAGLTGEDEPLVAPGGKWSNAGYVLGPKRAVAWRVLDAQYFGVAQRRRRVFVVASAREGFDPAAVLFEWDGVRRDSAPSREAGETTSHAIAPSLTCSGRGFDRVGETRGQDPVVAIMAHGQGGAEIARERSPTLTCNHEAPIVTRHVVHGTQDPCVSQLQQPQAGRPCHPLAAGAVLQPAIAGTLGANHGNIKAEHAWTGQLLPVPAYATQAGALRTNPNSGPDGIGVQKDHAYTLEARAEVQAVCVSLRGREGGGTAELGDDVGNCLRASGGGGDKAYVLASVAVRDISQTITSNYGKQVDSSDTALGPNAVFPAMKVRRLTPMECERLQGFPDSYTKIPWRKKPAADCPDGPRYKAIGNSMAVPVMAWIGQRINNQIENSENGQTEP